MRAGYWHNLPFRRKLILFGGLVSSAALLFAGIAMISFESASFRNQFLNNISTVADITSQTCASALTFQDEAYATKILYGLSAEEAIINACIYQSDGDILATFHRNDSNYIFPKQQTLPTTTFSGNNLVLTKPITFGGEQVGTIFIQAELVDLPARLEFYGLITILIMLISLAVGLTLAHFFQKAIIKPIVELQQTAIQVSRSQDYTARAKLFGRDELGQLTRSFNEMLTQIQHRDNALSESEAKYSNLLSRIDEVIFRLEMPENIFEYCSPGAKAMFGYSAEELVANPELFRSIIHPDSRDYLDQMISAAAIGNVAPTFEYQILHKNGDKKWLVQTNSPTYDWAGSLTAIEGCCIDVTDRILAQQAQEKLKTELAQSHKLEALGTLTGGIAHDFNNMLGAIMGNISLADDVLEHDHAAKPFLDPIIQASERASKLVRQILTFSRQDRQEKSPVHVVVILNEALTLIRASLPSTITIKTDIRLKNDLILADSTQLHQVVMNLCTNSRYAMEESGGLLQITAKPLDLSEEAARLSANLKPGSYIEISIADTGVGISQDHLDRIFEPFFTTKPKNEGTGMGLSVVYGIVREHEGSIKVESRVDEGTTFQILLPCIAGEVKISEPEPEDSLQGSGRILFVDDEEMLTRVCSLILQRFGYSVTCFTNPWLALKEFNLDPFAYDLVLSDLTMPNLTGVDLAAKIHKIREDLPIVICTGNLDHLDLIQAREYGIVDIATKPFNSQRIGKLVRSHILSHNV